MSLDEKTGQYLWLGLIIVATALFCYTSHRPGPAWDGDAAQYLYQARGIAEGSIDQVVQRSTYRYDHSDVFEGPALVPWGFPVLLSPIYRIFGLNVELMKAYVNTFFILSLFVIFAIFRERLTYRRTLLLVTIVAVNPAFFQYKDSILSDIPFFFFALLTIYLIQQIVILKKAKFMGPAGHVALGCVMFFAYYVRFQGIILPATFLVCQFIEQRRSGQGTIQYAKSHRLGLTPYALFLVLALLSGLILPGRTISYLRSPGFHLARDIIEVAKNVHGYALVYSDFFGPFSASAIVYGITVPFAVLGAKKNLSQDYLYLVFIGLTLLLLIPLPYAQPLRYVFAFLPFYLYFAFEGLSGTCMSEILHGRHNPLRWNPVGVFGIAIILVSCTGLVFVRSPARFQHVGTGLSGMYRWNWGDSADRDSREMFEYIRRNTADDAVVMFWRPRALALCADRPSIIAEGYEKIMSSGVRYLVRSKELEDLCHIDSVICEHQGDFGLVFRNASFAVYKVRTAADLTP